MMLWRLRMPTRVRRDDPSEFVPCMPTIVARPPEGAHWLHEVKHDGYRMIARKDGDRVRLSTRRQDDCGDEFPQIAEAILKLPVDHCTIDGEAAIIREGGRSDFHALADPAGRLEATLVCSDLIELAGDDIRHHPIEERRGYLFSILEDDEQAPLIFSQVFNHDGADVFARVCTLGLEGMISKRRASVYRFGSSIDWVVTSNTSYARI